MQQNLVTLVNNAAIKRGVILNGRSHIVIPSKTLPFDVVMNRILYPKDTIEKTFHLLNETPAPIGHPKDSSGKFISAKSQEGRNIADVGAWTKNAKIVGNRVESEVWIDEERAKKFPEGLELLRRIDEGKPISTSVAVKANLVNTKGGNYDSIADIIDFDHNAILFNEAPAASIEQGVGLIVNTAEAVAPEQKEKYGIIQRIEQLFNKKDEEMEEDLKKAQARIAELEAKLAEKDKKGEVVANEEQSKQLEEMKAKIDGLTTLLNAKAEDDLKALRAKVTPIAGEIVANQLNKEGLEAILDKAGATAQLLPNSAVEPEAEGNQSMEDYVKGLQ